MSFSKHFTDAEFLHSSLARAALQIVNVGVYVCQITGLFSMSQW